MTDLFTCCSVHESNRAIWGKSSDKKLRASTLVNDETLRIMPTSHQHSAVLIKLKYLIFLRFV